MGGKSSKGKMKLEESPTKEKEDVAEKKDKESTLSEPQIPPVSFLQLFRYATTADKILLILGVLSAAVSGVSMPGMVILFGQITDAMVSNGRDSNGGNPCGFNLSTSSSPITTQTTDATAETEKLDDFLNELAKLSLYQTLLGLGQLVVGYFFVTCFNRVSENIVFRLRKNYLEALLRQNVGWFDTSTDRNFVSRIAEDSMKVQEATGEKVGLCIFFMSTSILSLGNAFWHGWLLTLVVLSAAPVLTIAAGVVTTIQSKLAATEQTAYAKAGTVAEEAITNVRTVFAFSGHEKEIARYEVGLEFAQSAGKKRGAISGLGMGLIWLIMYASYALAFWYGTKLILDGIREVCDDPTVVPDYTADNMIIVFFSVLMGAFNVGQSASYFEAFAVGRGSAAVIYQVIDRVPEIDSYSETGLNPKGKALGKIKFESIKFSYPSRVDVPVLTGLNLSVEPSQTVALVGHSGCGKSTCLQLLQRFYDPLEGNIYLDGTELKNLNLGWLRDQIGVVSQEPILFNTSILENIRYGREGVTQQEVEEACRQSHAHKFIAKLPNGYNTLVGDRGAQLSGGQKQRIAIARALVRNPSILLLDEATSALDTQSESIVQKALDKARKGRTTLIVAHRLSTIRAADVVVSINDGKVVEKGTHEQLLANKGLYYQLVTSQMNQGGQGGSEELVESDVNDNGQRRLSTRKSIPEEMDDEESGQIVPIVAEDLLSEKELAKQAPLKRLMMMNMPEWKWILAGLISSIIQGCILPFYAVIFGDFLGVLADQDLDKAQNQANTYAIMFLIVGLVAGGSMFLQMLAFSYAGEALTSRLRKMTFAAMLRQEPGWYDNPHNSIGALCARLAGDAASVQGATGSRIGSLVQSVSTIVLALILSMYYLPKLAAVALAFVPIVGITTYYQGGLLTGQNIEEKNAIEESSKVAVQAVSNIRTVASLCREKTFANMYSDALMGPHKLILKRAHIRGFIFGFSQSMPLFAYAAVMYYGAYLIRHENVDFQKVFKVAESLIFGTMMVGQTLAFAPNYNKAKISGSRILRLLDRKPEIDTSNHAGLGITNSQGSVIFDHVAFQYPTRPTAKILRDLTFGVEPGKKIAIVGPSGGGKSTIVQLILRFYDPVQGKVKYDEVDVAALNVEALRKQMAIVSQEPALFDRSLAENIAYGDNSRQVPMSDIIAAARSANIHDFITSLPSGYETRVGEMGSQLSGGQKQRVAIARSLVRNPKLLLFDESTAALDMESEQIVQQALNSASEGRTSITIAHRLSSIQNSDRILVINNGELAESGTHDELLLQKGIYCKLWNMQGGIQKNNNVE